MSDVLPPTREMRALSPRDLLLNRVIDCLEYVESYSVSARASAWRGDEGGLEEHLKALRLAVVEALKTFREVKPDV